MRDNRALRQFDGAALAFVLAVVIGASSASVDASVGRVVGSTVCCPAAAAGLIGRMFAEPITPGQAACHAAIAGKAGLGAIAFADGHASLIPTAAATASTSVTITVVTTHHTRWPTAAHIAPTRTGAASSMIAVNHTRALIARTREAIIVLKADADARIARELGQPEPTTTPALV